MCGRIGQEHVQAFNKIQMVSWMSLVAFYCSSILYLQSRRNWKSLVQWPKNKTWNRNPNFPYLPFFPIISVVLARQFRTFQPVCQDVDILKIHTETRSTRRFTWDLVNCCGKCKGIWNKAFCWRLHIWVCSRMWVIYTSCMTCQCAQEKYLNS